MANFFFYPLIILMISSNLLFASENIYGKITEVTDGDTIKFLSNDGNLIKVRLSEIDAPEFKSIDSPEKNQRYGLESKNSLSELCLEEKGLLKVIGKDRYDRTLGIVYCNEINANIFQLQSGLAWVYDQYVSEYEYYRYQNEAKSLNLGIWSEDYPLPPWDFRKGKSSYDYRIKELEIKIDNLIKLSQEQILIYENKLIEIINKFEKNNENFSNDSQDQFSCIKKSCKQMLNCEEAYFQYQQCGNTSLDRDKDGIPCESIC